MEGLRLLQKQHPTQVFVENKFAEPFAHKIYAGVDLFFMPSRFEPCGLGQLIAMRYGALPVVTPTGGLKDTVQTTTSRSVGTGFVARDTSPEGFLSAALNAMALMNDVPGWRSAQRRAMMADYSWKKSTTSYLALYDAALAQRAR
jgi:starch synthase